MSPAAQNTLANYLSIVIVSCFFFEFKTVMWIGGVLLVLMIAGRAWVGFWVFFAEFFLGAGERRRRRW